MSASNLSLTERLAQHLQREADAATVARARLHLLDWLGCVAGARRSAAAAVGAKVFADAIERAALLGNVMEMDDVHRTALLHPGPVVWPAVLLAARETGAGMQALLAAAVAGYEAMITVGASFDGHHYAHWHNSASAGGFGAAAAAARLFGADASAVADALGHAGSLAGGLWRMRHEPGLTKQVHIWQAAVTGVRHARLAAAGAGGPRRILEGAQGLYAAMTREPRLFELRPGWRIAEVSFKPWGACRHAHPAIDAALMLRSKGALAGELAGGVEVATYADALAFCDRPSPTTAHEAKFSLQHAVAVVIAKGEPALADFEPDAIARLAPLRAKVRVIADAGITAAYPAHFGARVSAGGQTVSITDTLGDPERPLAADGVVAKARALMDWGGIGADAAAAAAEVALGGDDPAAVIALLEQWL